jgi:hypothetical protein
LAADNHVGMNWKKHLGLGWFQMVPNGSNGLLALVLWAKLQANLRTFLGFICGSFYI